MFFCPFGRNPKAWRGPSKLSTEPVHLQHRDLAYVHLVSQLISPLLKVSKCYKNQRHLHQSPLRAQTLTMADGYNNSFSVLRPIFSTMCDACWSLTSHWQNRAQWELIRTCKDLSAQWGQTEDDGSGWMSVGEVSRDVNMKHAVPAFNAGHSGLGSWRFWSPWSA